MHRRGNAAVVTDAVETLMQRLGVSASGTSREAYVESLLAGAARPSSKEVCVFVEVCSVIKYLLVLLFGAV